MNFLNELQQIDGHFMDVNSAILEYFTQILNGDFHNRPDLSNSTITALMKLRDARVLENERAISLTMLAALESWFRKDCQERAEKRERSPLGRKFKSLYAASHKSISKIKFDDILDAWSRVQPETRPIIRQVKAVFNYRHWLAHGRYWTPKLGRQYDYDTVYGIAQGAATLLGPSERGTA